MNVNLVEMAHTVPLKGTMSAFQLETVAKLKAFLNWKSSWPTVLSKGAHGYLGS